MANTYVCRYLLYVDELAPINAAPIIAFKGRLLRRQPQLDPVLNALPAIFARFYDLYEPFPADLMFSSFLEFISGTALEPQTKNLPLVRCADRFPLYLRELSGIGEAYAHMIFPKRLGVSIVEYIEAVPDMVIWIDLSNDLLSSVSLFFHLMHVLLTDKCELIQVLQRGAWRGDSYLRPPSGIS